MSLGKLYETHHRERRNAGDFVFVPEHPLFQEAIGRASTCSISCRSGALTRHFLAGNDVVGVDVDEAALAAEELGIDVVTADVEEPLPLESETFDAVVAGELLEHVLPAGARRRGTSCPQAGWSLRGLRAECVPDPEPVSLPPRASAR